MNSDDDYEEEEEEQPMAIDSGEDSWTRLHDISVNGSELSYIGKGISIHDNGLAQASAPLTPINHYFEIKIVNPGDNCYIAIGLARRDYPLHKHPGWNRGSIAYHADDGKIFIGSGVGSPFGPKANVNDVLGCGIVFPINYSDPPLNGKKKRWPWELPYLQHQPFVEENKVSSSSSGPSSSKGAGGSGLIHHFDYGGEPSRRRRRHCGGDDGPGHYPQNLYYQFNSIDNVHQQPPPPPQYYNEIDYSSESEDDIWWNNKNNVYEDKVKVFFMRNAKLLGIKEVRIPFGGFYPTIGMLGTNEKVNVDLHPLTG